MRYAIEIQPEDLDLITMLNSGVTPVPQPGTYFVFEAKENSDVPNQIVNEDELVSWDQFAFNPTIHRLK